MANVSNPRVSQDRGTLGAYSLVNQDSQQGKLQVQGNTLSPKNVMEAVIVRVSTAVIKTVIKKGVGKKRVYLA